MFFTYLGICDPYDSEACAADNNWDFCNITEFNCPALNAEGNVGFLSVIVAPRKK